MRQLRITQQITNRDSLSIEKYLIDIAKEGLLTGDQEVSLALKIQEGDPLALEELTKGNLRFVVSVAKQYQNQGFPLSDLINEGNIGLIKAAKRFDASKGFKFISYAVWWIRQSIMQAIIDKSRLIRLPLNKSSAFNKINKASAEFEQKHQRRPNIMELESITGIESNAIISILNNSLKHVSMDAPVGDHDEFSLSDVLEDKSIVNADIILAQQSLKSELNGILASISDREREILSCYFGLNGENRMTLAEIGEKFGLTRERVRQLKEKSLRRLRKTSKSDQLVTYLD